MTAASLERFGVTLDLVAVVPPPLPVHASSGRVLRAPDAPAGETILHAFETASLIDDGAGQPRLTIVAAGTAPGWRRAAVQYSLDEGKSWIAAGATAAPGVVGRLSAALAAAPATLADRRNAIDVMLAHDGMTLANADAAALDRGANLALVGDELLQFGMAQPLGGAAWRLTQLWRGRRGSIPAALAPGTRFVLLDSDSALVLALDAAIGARVRVLASGVGDAEPAETECVIGGASALPPAPVRLSGRVVGGALALSWRRRSRTDWRWRDGVDAALGEEREAYRMTITSGAGTSGAGTQTIETGEARALIPLSADAIAPLSITVRQIGRHGASPAALLTL